MEMELMVKESVTGRNKSKRERAAVSDRKIWTKTGSEFKADMEGGEGRSTRGQEVRVEQRVRPTGGRQPPRHAPKLFHHSSEDKPPRCPLRSPKASWSPSYHVHYLSVNLMGTTFPSPRIFRSRSEIFLLTMTIWHTCATYSFTGRSRFSRTHTHRFFHSEHDLIAPDYHVLEIKPCCRRPLPLVSSIKLEEIMRCGL